MNEYEYETITITKTKRRNYANYVFMIGRHKIVNGIGRRRWLGGGMPGQRGADHGPLVGHVRQLRLSWYIRRYLQRLGQLSVSASPLESMQNEDYHSTYLQGIPWGILWRLTQMSVRMIVVGHGCALLSSNFSKSSTNWDELPMQSSIFLAKDSHN